MYDFLLSQINFFYQTFLVQSMYADVRLTGLIFFEGKFRSVSKTDYVCIMHYA